MTESLNDIKLSKQEITTELEYTISLTDPRLIAKCIDELQQLPDTDGNYKFNDLDGNAKAGVLRVYKKYGKTIFFVVRKNLFRTYHTLQNNCS